MVTREQVLWFGGTVGALSLIVWAMGDKVKAVAGGWIAPVTGRLTSKFGLRPDPLNPKKMQGHNGQDIAVPIGTKIVAPRDGVVKTAAFSAKGGNQIVLLHDNGWFTGYAHLSKMLVKKGDKVKQGQVIALSGNTGVRTTGPHLHLTMTNPKGVKVDPAKYLYA